ncbi:MAG: lipoate--protein ligase [Bacteroides sp.]|nr:lipoate--protein ligase [Bacteroides sp.]
MHCIISDHTDPYFNLASEEVLLRSRTEDYFLIYRNRPSIVVGKHQNTLAEINLPYVDENGIIVVRRISGGGTVFHDMGNLNFAFITSGKEGELVDYKQHTLPIIAAMKNLGLDVSLGKRNELLLGKKKISGTASHVFKNRVMHHGTLLFSSEMKDLSSALKVKAGKFEDRAVKSVRSEVTNICDHLDEQMEIDDFQKLLFESVRASLKAIRYSYSEEDLREISELTRSKFSTWEWNFGYSPRYQFNKVLQYGEGKISIHMNVVKGIIQEITIRGDFIGSQDIQILEELLTGNIHDPQTIRTRLSTIKVEAYIDGLGNEMLLSGMF